MSCCPHPVQPIACDPVTDRQIAIVGGHGLGRTCIPIEAFDPVDAGPIAERAGIIYHLFAVDRNFEITARAGVRDMDWILMS